MPHPAPASHGFGLYGPDFGYPPGGLCLSVFLNVVRDDHVLVGRMRASELDRWVDEWAPNIAFYEGPRRERLFQGLRLPATYLQVGEDPAVAAGRLWRDQLGFQDAPRFDAGRVVSDAGPSRRDPDEVHWDLFVLYTVEGPPLPAKLPSHWEELHYRDPDTLDSEEMVMLHGELLPLLR